MKNSDFSVSFAAAIGACCLAVQAAPPVPGAFALLHRPNDLTMRLAAPHGRSGAVGRRILLADAANPE